MKVNKKQVYIWNMLGSMCNALASIVFLSIVVRTLGEVQQDIFSIGFSIAQLMLTLATFQVRVFQATDVEEQFCFNDYLVFRIITSFIMVVCSIIYIIIKGYTDEKAWVMLLLCIYKMTTAFSDVLEGLFQQKERLDISGKLICYNTVLSMIVFAVVLMVSKNLILGCTFLILVSVLVILIYGVRNARRFTTVSIKGYEINKCFTVCKSIASKCLPIFINGFLSLLIFNIPKNSIDRAISMGLMENGYQTYYNIIFMPANTINLMFIFFRPQITQMAIFLSEKKLDSFSKIIKRLFLYISVFTLLACVGGFLLGVPVLNIIYSKDVSPFKWLIILLLIGGGFSTIGALYDNVLTVIRKQYFSTVAYGASAIVTYIISNGMVYKHGLKGAVGTFIVSMVVLAIFEIVLSKVQVKKIVSITENANE